MYLFRCSLGLEWEEQGISFLLFHLFLFIRFPLRSPFFMPSPNLKKKETFFSHNPPTQINHCHCPEFTFRCPRSRLKPGWMSLPHRPIFKTRKPQWRWVRKLDSTPPPVHPAVWTVADRAITAHLGNKAEASPFRRVRLRSTTVVLFNISVCVALSEWYWLLGEAAAGVGGDGQEGCREPSLAVRLRSAAQLLLRQGNRVRTNI